MRYLITKVWAPEYAESFNYFVLPLTPEVCEDVVDNAEAARDFLESTSGAASVRFGGRSGEWHYHLDVEDMNDVEGDPVVDVLDCGYAVVEADTMPDGGRVDCERMAVMRGAPSPQVYWTAYPKHEGAQYESCAVELKVFKAACEHAS